MRAKRRVIFAVAMLTIFAGCGNKRSQDDKVLFGENKAPKETITIHRFDKALFESGNTPTEQYLLSIEKDFKPMFAANLSDKQYMQVVKAFVQDKQMQSVHKTVVSMYPDLKWLEDDLAKAMSKIRQIRPDSTKTNIYTLILGPAEYSFAYQNRILVYPEYSAISIDLYSMDSLSDNPYYKTMPEYLRASLKKENIAPDYVRTYLQEITFRDIPLSFQNPEATLLDCIIDDGKYSYAVAALLPEYGLNTIFRYTPAQQQWVETNEYNIWTYIIQNQLLYCKDRTKYLSLIAEGPSTKGINNSPARIGNYIGYKIVCEYMDKNPITLDSLFKIDKSEQILKASGYKPKKTTK